LFTPSTTYITPSCDTATSLGWLKPWVISKRKLMDVRFIPLAGDTNIVNTIESKKKTGSRLFL
jgi:hypothetical protein